MTNLGNSQKARDFVLVAPLILYLLYNTIFFGFLFYVFGSGRVDLKDSTIAALIASAVNQGFSAMIFMVQVIYYREKAGERAPFRKDDIAGGTAADASNRRGVSPPPVVLAGVDEALDRR